MQFITLDVFTDTSFLGNPLAVVIVEDKERDGLSQDRKQAIAAEFNLSETVFLYLRPGETLQHPDRSSSVREVSIFTIEAELTFAGHPTIGTAYLLLRHLGWDFVDTIVPPCGPIRLTKLDRAAGGGGGGVLASIPHDVHVHRHTLRTLCEQGGERVAAQVRAALHDDADIRAAELDAPVVSIVKGMTFILTKLPSLEHLGKVGVGRRLVQEVQDGLLDAGPWARGLVARYFYVHQGVAAGAADARRGENIRARMVELGFEDPATGSAASSLTSYLSLTGDVDDVDYRITQGVEMGRKSDIEVSVTSRIGDDGSRVIKELKLGGTAKVVMKGDIIV